jgi:hypothetical protein
MYQKANGKVNTKCNYPFWDNSVQCLLCALQNNYVCFILKKKLTSRCNLGIILGWGKNPLPSFRIWQRRYTKTLGFSRLQEWNEKFIGEWFNQSVKNLNPSKHNLPHTTVCSAPEWIHLRNPQRMPGTWISENTGIEVWFLVLDRPGLCHTQPKGTLPSISFLHLKSVAVKVKLHILRSSWKHS